MNTKKVFIAYGWAEGPKIAKKFITELINSGFDYTPYLEESDIVFAHSAGIYFLPSDLRSKKVIVNGVPYWPDRSMLKSILLKQLDDIKHHHNSSALGWWGYKILNNIYYMLCRPRVTFGVYQAKKHFKIEDLIAKNDVFVVRNQTDTFTTPKISKESAWKGAEKFISVGGSHDDCWLNPKSYIDILNMVPN